MWLERNKFKSCLREGWENKLLIFLLTLLRPDSVSLQLSKGGEEGGILSEHSFTHSLTTHTHVTNHIPYKAGHVSAGGSCVKTQQSREDKVWSRDAQDGDTTSSLRGELGKLSCMWVLYGYFSVESVSDDKRVNLLFLKLRRREDLPLYHVDIIVQSQWSTRRYMIF